ncbi:phosphotransferase [Dyella sedimenti]|uniref:phosphotransferase n=1 Tax=Dyella sedimenti TaxID=2919947 RepID=UPI001FAA4387|nr:phosphotransferase [Dyella sedimenti]
MLAKADWAHLIPHRGAMCLLDAVLSWDDAGLHAVASVADGHPLRGALGLHAVHLAEYGAQAMALHGALLVRGRGVEAARPGRLVGLRDVELWIEYVDAGHGRLDVHAERLYADSGGAQYAFRVEQAGRRLASGRAAVLYVAT